MNAEVQELLDLVQQLRPLGDSKGALEVLRKADTISPDNPEVLKELALTYEVMGLKEKAAAARDRAAALRGGGASLPLAAASVPMEDAAAGSTIGGGLSSDDGRGLSSPAMGGLSTPEARPHDPSKALSIGRCELLRDRGTTRGEKVTLRLPIRSQPGQAIDPTAIDIDVFFFDLVNGEKVEQTKADVPVNTWVDAPVDWKDGAERLDVVYSMPEMTADVIRGIGQRRFHGYIVKLYYQHKLQDTVMEPASLQHFGTGNAPQPAGNPLLPPVAR